MNKFHALAAALLLGAASAGAAESGEYFVKELLFPADADSITKIEMAARLVPSQKQVAWQNLEMTAFLHFGPNTFTGREWGDGSEDPQIFNPEELDAEQWVKTLKDTGFKLVILTAKHHDGFCLWPSKTTSHSVASSPWRDGKGDVVKELADACHKYDMKLGLYLSPWDRNAECYGDSPRYNDMFVAQLRELLTNYGTVDEVWFDGACGEGPNGKKQVYDWDRFRIEIEKMQPNAVVAIMGDDVRWVGNEAGMGRETEWSATALTPGIRNGAAEANARLGLYAKAPDLGGRDIIVKADKLYWWPSEVDVSIRPGWFFHETENPKSLYELANIYLNSVGRNSVLLLNIPPNKQGLINDNDVERLGEFHRWISGNFSHNLAVEATDTMASLGAPTRANCVVVQEDITRGQRVEEFDILGLAGNKWRVLASGTTVGKKRILRFPPAEIEAVKIEVRSARGDVNLLPLEVYNIEMPEPDKEMDSKYRKLPKAAWRVLKATDDSVSTARNAIDGNPATFWQSASKPGAKELVIDMEEAYPISGFTYQPRAGENQTGTVFKYRFMYSANGRDWAEALTSREFSNIDNNPIEQKIYFPQPVNARFVMLVAEETVGGADYATVAGIDILVTPKVFEAATGGTSAK